MKKSSTSSSKDSYATKRNLVTATVLAARSPATRITIEKLSVRASFTRMRSSRWGTATAGSSRGRLGELRVSLTRYSSHRSRGGALRRRLLPRPAKALGSTMEASMPGGPFVAFSIASALWKLGLVSAPLSHSSRLGPSWRCGGSHSNSHS